MLIAIGLRLLVRWRNTLIICTRRLRWLETISTRVTFAICFTRRTRQMQWLAYETTRPGRIRIEAEEVRHGETLSSSFFFVNENHLLGLSIARFVVAEFFSFEWRFPLQDGLEVKIKSPNPRGELRRAARAAAKRFREWTI